MSIDSIHRERWVEADMGNKIKLNHWIQGCRTMHRIQDEKERTKYRIIRKRGYLRMIHRTFRDWKVLALLKFKSNKARLRRVFFSLWIPHEFYSRLLGVLKYRQRLTLKSRLHQWKKNIDNSKLMKIRARRSAFLYLQRAGRVAILGQRILLRWLHHNLAQRFFRWKYNTRALKSMEQQVSERRDFLVMYECLRSWLRVRSRRLAISLLFQRCTLHFLMAGFYAIRRTTKPVVEVVPAQSPPPKSPVPPPPVLVVSTEGEEYSMDNDEEEEEEAQDEEPEVDVSQNAVNISALSANTDHSMKLEKCNCMLVISILQPLCLTSSPHFTLHLTSPHFTLIQFTLLFMLIICCLSTERTFSKVFTAIVCTPLM